jgi:MFS transporter, DHA1 family, multidrug resistance protein
MSRRFLIIFCGLLLTSNAFSTDILLPALFSMELAFAAPLEQVQIAMPLFIFASAFGQIIYGPVSDRFGRKLVLLAGLAIYTLAALIALMAQSLGVLLFARALQRFGSAAGIVLGRAILRDTHSGAELAQSMAMAMAVITLGPVLSPLAGTGLVALGGWQSVFGAMAVFGMTLAAVAIWKLEETNKALRPDALDRRELAIAFKRVLSHPQSRFFLFVAAALGFTIISFIAHAPRFFRSTFGIEGIWFAAMFALLGMGIVVGQIFNTQSIRRYGVLNTTRAAAVILTVVTALMAVLTALSLISAIGFGILMLVFNGAFLSMMANAASLTIDPHAEIAGLASSVYGFVTQLVPGALALATLPLIRGELTIWASVATVVAIIVLTGLIRYRPASEPHLAVA